MGQSLPSAKGDVPLGGIPWQCSGAQLCIDLNDACLQDDVVTRHGAASAFDEVMYPLHGSIFASPDVCQAGGAVASNGFPEGALAGWHGGQLSPAVAHDKLDDDRSGGFSPLKPGSERRDPPSPACWNEAATPPAPAERSRSFSRPDEAETAAERAPTDAGSPVRRGGCPPAQRSETPSAEATAASPQASSEAASALPPPAALASSEVTPGVATAAAAAAGSAVPKAAVGPPLHEAPCRGDAEVGGAEEVLLRSAMTESLGLAADSSPSRGDNRTSSHRPPQGSRTGQAAAVERLTLEAVHPKWKGHLTLAQDGSFHRNGGILVAGDAGRWSIIGSTLNLVWDDWDPEQLSTSDEGRTFVGSGGFRLAVPRGRQSPDWLRDGPTQQPAEASTGGSPIKEPRKARPRRSAPGGRSCSQGAQPSAAAAEERPAPQASAEERQRIKVVTSDWGAATNREVEDLDSPLAAARGLKLFHISDWDIRPPPNTVDKSGMAPLPGWNGNVGRQRAER